MLADTAYDLASRIEADWDVGTSTAGETRHYGYIDVTGCSGSICPIAGYYSIGTESPVLTISIYMLEDPREGETYVYASEHNRALVAVLRALGYTRAQAAEIVDVHLPHTYEREVQGFSCNTPSGLELDSYETPYLDDIQWITGVNAVRYEYWNVNTACLAWGPP